MELLREFIRQIMVETARGPNELPEGVYVAIEEKHDGYRVFYASEEGYEISTREIAGSVAVSSIDRDCDGALEVFNATAYAGWGPMLYDIAMEIASQRGGGLVSDRQHVSVDAQRIWSYYLKRRPDVTAIPLKQNCIPETSEEDALFYRYTKEPTTIDALRSMGRVIEDLE